MQLLYANSITPQETQAKLACGDSILLLDVREPMELAWAFIPNAIHIPMREIPDRYQELNVYKNAEIVVFCHAGVRSYQVMRYLQTKGFSHIKNLEGGIDSWSTEVDPTVPRY
ncbi:hypothetical protein GF373_17000 [bacterium]|nr:hypothetical protein [bacterium]